MYLKEWAKDFNCPIVSVDYSLAPEHQFPAAVEEGFFAYCWILKNCALLGTAAKKVIFTGDSAGGNLCLSIALKVTYVNRYTPIS